MSVIWEKQIAMMLLIRNQRQDGELYGKDCKFLIIVIHFIYFMLVDGIYINNDRSNFTEHLANKVKGNNTAYMIM
jgi:hypothetical protein